MLTSDRALKYSSRFFTLQDEIHLGSAVAVVPLVLSLLPVKSVIDVGCGTGVWAAGFISNGVQDVWGVDGDYIPRSQLHIPSERFLARDLEKPFQLEQKFDLAVCLEVAEHLPKPRAKGLVADLTSLASCVLFSAAVPGQGGTHHVNEQYLPYWVSLFQSLGYEGTDPIRPRILGDNSVAWYYQQNLVMFAASGHPLLAKGFSKPNTIIHQKLYESVYEREITLGVIAKALPGALRRSIRYRLGHRALSFHA